MMLEERPQGGQVQLVDALHEHHGVRIAHGDRRDRIGAAIHLDGVGDAAAIFLVHAEHGRKLHRDAARHQDGFAHVHRGAADGARLELQADDLDARGCFQADDVLFHQTAVIGILAHAARGIAAHFGLGAVGIEHAHPEIGHPRGQDEHQTVRTHAEMPVAHARGKLTGIVDLFFKTIDVDIVVADALHLGEAQFTGHAASLIRRVSDAGGKKNASRKRRKSKGAGGLESMQPAASCVRTKSAYRLDVRCALKYLRSKRQCTLYP